MHKTILSAFALSTLLVVGCANLPNDQHESTTRIRQSGTIVVGVSRENDNAALFEKREKPLVEKIAARLDAKIEWRADNAHRLLEDLEDLKLPLVAASVSCDTPFADRIGLSKPYFTDENQDKEYCLAIAPGENRLLLLVDETIAEEQSRNQR